MIFKVYLFVPQTLKVCGNLGFRLFEHFVEHRKLVTANFVPNIREVGKGLYLCLLRRRDLENISRFRLIKSLFDEKWSKSV